MPEIAVEKTQRGFGIGKFNDANGTPCSFQDSSLATAAAVWFGVQDANPQRLVNGVWEPVPPPEGPYDVPGYPGIKNEVMFTDRMHLGEDDIKFLAKKFEKFLEKGKVKGLKFKDMYGKKCSLRMAKTQPSSIGLIYDCIELGCDDPEPQICHGGWHPVVYPEGTVFTTHMFLAVDEVVELLPLMYKFLKEGCIR